MPIGALSILAIALVALTGVTSDKPAEAVNDALSSFANPLIWLIGVAIMISRALIKTGLGARIAYEFVALFAKRTLGIGYALAPAELTIAPIINQVLRDYAGPLPEPDPIHAAILFFLDREVHDRVPVGRPEGDGCGSAGPFNPGVREWRRVCSTKLLLRQCFP